MFRLFLNFCISIIKRFKRNKFKVVEKMEKFHGTIAVVTGASSGIGLGIVEKLLDIDELEVVGFSRREMKLSQPNYRKSINL